MDQLKSIYDYIFSSYKRLSALLIIAGLLLVIPISMSFFQQNQDIRQRASETPPAPVTTTNVAFSNPISIIPNGTTKYSLVITSTNSTGGDKITQQYALVNYQGTQAGNHRGFVGWSSVGFEKYWSTPPSFKSGTTPLACFLPSGGGTYPAGKAAEYSGYGSEYMNVMGCYTSVDGNVRTTKFDIQFNPNFATPLTNSISGFSENDLGQNTGWQEFSSFSIVPIAPTCTPRPGGMDGFLNNDGSTGTTGVAGLPNGGSYCPNVAPTSTNATIEPAIITADGTTQYKITLTSSDPQGGNTIFRQYAAINLQGANEGQYRGDIGWSAAGYDKYWYSSYKSGTTPINCTTGGGKVAIFGGNGGETYGAQYINAVSCSTSSTGNTRTTILTVSFTQAFTTPTTNNTISAFTADAGELFENWKAFQTFDLAGTSVGNPNDLEFKIKLQGIGPNKQIIHLVRTADLNFYNSAGALTYSKTMDITYSAANGIFTGKISTTSMTAGNYTVKIKTAGSLRKQLPGIINVQPNAAAQSIPVTLLIMGDVNGDNVINLTDYTLIISCMRNNDACTAPPTPTPTDHATTMKFGKNIFAKANN